MTNLVVLAGPTAVGKGTLVRALRQHNAQVWVSVSATTREPRPGEIDGVDYHFLSRSEFDRMILDGEFLEWATVHGENRYGTPRAPVLASLEAGHPSILEIDLQGARQVRVTMPDAVFVFLAPPSWEELVKRLEGRGTEDQEERERRLATAKLELEAASEFDITIVNDDLERAVRELERVVLDAR